MAAPINTAEAGTSRPFGRGRMNRGFALALVLPMPVWQVLFFVAPLAFLVVMSFWTVENFRLTPDLSLASWTKVYGTGYFREAYLRTVGYGALAALLSSIIAFPCAYAIAFKLSPLARRLIVCSLIIPYFTNYLVRSYSWKILLTEYGVFNTVLGWIGLGPFSMTSNLFAVMVGYLTLTLPIVILLQYFSLANIDRTLIEAAQNLGCRRVATVFLVIVPAARIGFILAATFAFILAFGDFVSPSFLGNNKPPTLSVLMVDAVRSGSNWPRASVIALTMVLTLLVVAFSALTAAYGSPRRSQ
jgi:spermidine/putrescine transport system permease protein